MRYSPQNLAALAACALIGILPLTAQITGIIAEPFANHANSGIPELEGMITYRVYAEMTNPDDEVSAIFGDISMPMSIVAAEGFYQSTFGSNLGWDINPAFLPFFADLSFDSWFTIGASNGGESSDMGNSIGLETAFEGFNNAGTFIIDDEIGGSIFTLAGDPTAVAGDDLRVLLAQFTTSGAIEGEFNVQMFINGFQNQSMQVINEPIQFLLGCNDETACNFDPVAAGSNDCIYATECTDCAGECIDLNEDGVCDCTETAGCTDETADNFDPLASEDDGSCIIGGCLYDHAANYNGAASYDNGSCVFEGCTNFQAVNFDPDAAFDDGTCLFLGCMDPVGLNFDILANLPGVCLYSDVCIADIDGDGNVDVFDLLIMFESYGYDCE